MIHPHILLLENDFNQSILSSLAQHFMQWFTGQGLTVVFLEPLRLETEFEVRRTLLDAAHKKGFYAGPSWETYPLSFVYCQNKTQVMELALEKANALLACPQQCIQNPSDTNPEESPEDVEVIFHDDILELIELIEEKHSLTLAVDVLEPVIREHTQATSVTPQYFSEKVFTSYLQEFLANYQHSSESLWEHPEAGSLVRFFIDAKPWASIFLPQKLRTFLDEAIGQALAEGHLNAQLLMAIFGRRLHESLAPHPQLKSHPEFSHFMQILPPVKNWKVTIIAPTYNRLSLFKRTIESILNQTYAHWELFIINHASTDGTSAYCKELQQNDPRIQVVEKTENKGSGALADYYEALFDQLDTELFISCPDDDFLNPEHLKSLITAFQERPWCGMAYGSYQVINEKGQATYKYGPLYNEKTVANPYIELQRALLAGGTPQTPLCRHQWLKTFVAWDGFVKKESKYAIHDFAIGIFMQTWYEAVHVPETLSNISAHETTVHAQQDMSRCWVMILLSLIMCHRDLYGAQKFPIKIVESYYKMTLGQILNILQHQMLAPNTGTVNTVEEKSELLKKMAIFHQKEIIPTITSMQTLFETYQAGAYHTVLETKTI